MATEPSASENAMASDPLRVRLLIRHISGRDDLPVGWKLAKKTRYSDGDIQDLQLQLEEKHDILKSKEGPPRSFSTSAEPPTSFSASAESQSSFSASAEPQSRQPKYFKRLEIFYRQISTMAITISSVRWDDKLPPIKKTSRDVQSVIWTAFRSLWEKLSLIFSEGLHFLQAVLLRVFSFAGVLWNIFKRPLVIIVAIVALFVLCLNIFATVYTVTHDSFLNSFCPKKLPVVRNILCNSWDQLRLERNAETQKQKNLNQPFDNYLKDGNSTLSYELPYYLNHLESIIRTLRSSLPESEYSFSEQEVFRNEFTDYIYQSSVTVHNSQEFYSHIMGTIQHHVSDTNWLVKKLNSTNFSNLTVAINGPLAQSMTFFHSYHMVYLIDGIEPFKENALQSITMKSAELMKDHVVRISKRLEVDVRMITSLQMSLNDLSSSLEIIEEHVSRCTSESRTESLGRSTPWAYFTWVLLGRTQSQYQIDQRRQWLDDMRPVFVGATAFLRRVATEFEMARLACLHVEERLTVEGRAARWGWQVSDWVLEQAQGLSAGIESIEFELKSFKEEKMRFNENIFPQQRESPEDRVPKTMGSQRGSNHQLWL